MIQVSEFGIIVAAVAFEGGFIPAEVLGFMTLLAIFTMAVSVYFVEFNHALFERFEPTINRWTGAGAFEGGKREYRDHVVVVGYDEVTKTRSRCSPTDTRTSSSSTGRSVTSTRSRKGYDVIFGDARNATIRKDAAVKGPISSSRRRSIRR